jgi:hypothetical protein
MIDGPVRPDHRSWFALHGAVLGLVLGGVVTRPVGAQQWELPVVNWSGDTMYTDLDQIERVAPHVYRAWSKYVYADPKENGAEALVQKEYDCEHRMRRVISAVFYDANHTVTWKSKKPGRWMPVTFLKGRRQWTAVCKQAEGRAPASFLTWLKSMFSSAAPACPGEQSPQAASSRVVWADAQQLQLATTARELTRKTPSRGPHR